ncbi:hypothetical protein BC827DRAFT_1159413 [Russula dissimulans]|nr:hypothetical protein BC827DRAFT_1159413 [Russula dissimulans]
MLKVELPVRESDFVQTFGPVLLEPTDIIKLTAISFDRPVERIRDSQRRHNVLVLSASSFQRKLLDIKKEIGAQDVIIAGPESRIVGAAGQEDTEEMIDDAEREKFETSKINPDNVPGNLIDLGDPPSSRTFASTSPSTTPPCPKEWTVSLPFPLPKEILALSQSIIIGLGRIAGILTGGGGATDSCDVIYFTPIEFIMGVVHQSKPLANAYIKNPQPA